MAHLEYIRRRTVPGLVNAILWSRHLRLGRPTIAYALTDVGAIPLKVVINYGFLL